MKQSDKIMPLLMCPSCNEGMREVNHSNLRIDVDPKCRGVWLHRGEIETLGTLVKQVDAEMSMRATTNSHQVYEQHHHRKRRSMSEIFEIFE